MANNSKMTWRFQYFVTKDKKERGPTKSEIKTARTKLCEPAKGDEKIYSATFGLSKSGVKTECKKTVNQVVDLQNTRRMLQDTFLPNGVLTRMKDIILANGDF
jgi:hypothetical protein